MARQRFYVTTPIYYVNDVPHIGHAYTTVAADVLARFHRQLGDDVFFLTGTDEHGQKIEQAAAANNETPIALADRVVKRFQELWQILSISNDDFIRTTQERHKKFVAEFFQEVLAKKDIYPGQYEDWYCTPCETFLTEGQLVDGKCPQCGRPVKKIKEDSYFFALSKYGEKLLALYEKNTEMVVQPESRRNEIRSFVTQGLKDLSISRTSFQWGIPLPGDAKHVIYVWFDALLNYISASRYLPDGSKRGTDYWPAQVHIVGKDILRFHAVFWPAFLLSAGYPLPRKVFAHGWWTVDGKKMSKSLGNVVDPVEVAQKYGADAFRYFLLREVPFGLDGNFSIQALETRINADLANDLGNLLSRTVAMTLKYIGEKPPALKDCDAASDLDRHLEDLGKGLLQNIKPHYDNLDFQAILAEVWKLVTAANRYIDTAQPWTLAKEPEANRGKIARVFATLLETLRLVALGVYPFMPTKSQEMWAALGMITPLHEYTPLEEHLKWGEFPVGNRITTPPHLFPRIAPPKK